MGGREIYSMQLLSAMLKLTTRNYIARRMSVHRSTVIRWENGTTPTDEHFEKLRKLALDLRRRALAACSELAGFGEAYAYSLTDQGKRINGLNYEAFASVGCKTNEEQTKYSTSLSMCSAEFNLESEKGIVAHVFGACSQRQLTFTYLRNKYYPQHFHREYILRQSLSEQYQFLENKHLLDDLADDENNRLL